MGLYLLLLLSVSLPSVRTRLAETLAAEMSRKIGSRVEVGNVKVDLFNTLTIDSLTIYDKAVQPMLAVGTAVGTIDLLPIILRNTIKISSLKVFGARAVLYRADANAPANYQFLIDSLMPKDRSAKSLEVDLHSMILRDIAIRYDVQSEPASGQPADLNHIDIERLNANLVFTKAKSFLAAKTADRQGLRIRSASMLMRNGVRVDNLVGNIEPDESGSYTADIKSLGVRLSNDLSGAIRDSRIMLALAPGGNDNFANKIAAIALDATLCINDCNYDLVVMPEGKDDSTVYAKNYNVAIRAKNTPSYLKAKICDWHKENEPWYAVALSDIDFDAHIVRADAANILNAFESDILNSEILNTIEFIAADGKAKVREGGATVYFDGNAKSNIFDINALIDINGSNAVYKITLARASVPLSGEDGSNIAVQDAVLNGQATLDRHNFVDIISLDGEQIISNITGNAKVSIGSFNYGKADRPIALNNINLALHSASAGNVDYTMSIDDPNADLGLKGTLANLGRDAHLMANADVNRLRLAVLGVGSTALPDLLAGNISVDARRSDGSIDDYTIKLSHFRTARLGTNGMNEPLGDIVLTCRPVNGNRLYTLDSDIAKGELTTNVGLSRLAEIVETQIFHALPSLNTRAYTHNAAGNPYRHGYGVLKMTVKNLLALSDYIDGEIILNQPLEIMGNTSEQMGSTSLTVLAPSLSIDGSRYKDLGGYFNCSSDSLGGVLMLTKYFGDEPVKLENHLSGCADKLFTETLWKNIANSGTYGNLKTATRLHRTANHNLSATTQILPSTLFISDTSWQISHATLEYSTDIMRISNLIVSRGEQYVNVNADFGKEKKNLFVQLNDVEVAYLLNLANFNPVEFAGKASGTIKNSALNPDKEIEAELFVRDFLFNGAYLGSLNAKGTFDIDRNHIAIDAKAQATYNDSTLINGLLQLNDKTLDFRFKSEKTNLQFLNKYIGGFIADLEGSTTGDFHLFGTFRDVQMEADEMIDYLKFKPKMLGVMYTMKEQPMQIRPDTIDFTGLVIRDPHGNEASVKGSVNHHFLYDFNYDIDFQLNRLQIINWAEQPTRTIWGKVFAGGQMNLHGTTSEVRLSGELSAANSGGIDDGSSLYYSSGNYGDNGEERDYIHFVSPHRIGAAGDGITNENYAASSENSTTDVWADIKLNTTPDITLNIVTDPATHDNMSLHGNGLLQLSYYNKGRFAINGLYAVNDGSYKLTIKDIIHKNFDIQPGGYLRFHGVPSEADINLKGVHRVNSVSLSDLNVGASQSNSTVGVDCILNFTGKASEPKVSFDIDFPRANNDENLLLKKFILTEEDRNMQAVYLLSIGRFYTYNYNDFSSANGGQSQSAVAMTSFLAGTLSGQINNILQDAFHITNWNFGTNIAAGRMGFNDMEVQGSLSGKMFNNRLLFNGNIGYRDQVTTYSNNFVGDFNLQWLLNKAGTISLKAYSETNDRYFTKSSLSTQGGGILFQRDFRRLRDFFSK